MATQSSSVGPAASGDATDTVQGHLPANVAANVAPQSDAMDLSSSTQPVGTAAPVSPEEGEALDVNMDDAPSAEVPPQIVPQYLSTMDQSVTGQVETVTRLPPSAQFTEPDWLYPQECEAVHREYRGADVPGFFKKGARQGSTSVDWKRLALFGVMHPLTGGWEHYGSPLAAPNNAPNLYRFSLFGDSQMPALRLHMMRTGSTTMTTCWIYSVSLEVIEGQASLKFSTPLQASYTPGALTRHDVKEVFNRGELWETSLTLRAPVANERQRVAWTGISRREIDTIVATFRAGQAQSPQERLIALLQVGAQRIHIFSPWQNARAEILDQSLVYFTQAMAMTVALGTFWFYVGQAGGIPRNSPEFPFAKMQVPRWLVTEWTLRSDGKRAQSTPKKWEAFRRIPQYPDADTFAFICRLALNREKQYQERAVRQMIDSKRASILAVFRPSPFQEDGFLVEMTVTGYDLNAPFSISMPAIDTMLSIHVDAETDEEKHLEYKGRIIDDHFGRKAHIAAYVTGQPRVFSDDPIGVKLLLKSDATSINREIAAVEIVQDGQARKEGVDIPALVPGAPETSARPGAFAASITKPQYDNYEKILKEWDLNKDQQNAARAAVKSETGVTLCHGPPGTGKTKMAVAAAHGLATLGKKVLVCAPSNESVDNTMETLTARAPNLRVVRFRSAYIKPAKKDGKGGKGRKIVDINVPEGEAEDAGDLAWKLVMQLTQAGLFDKTDPNAYNVQLLRFITRTASGPRPELAKKAREYLESLARSRESEGKQDSKKLRQKLAGLEDEMATEFWKTVDVAFTTCNASCHDAIWGRFRPDFAFIDEAGQATAPTIATPLAAFIESLTGVMLVGDHLQLLPVSVSEDRNEGYEALRISLFQALKDDALQRYPSITLTHQYRMHPDIASWISQQFYEGKLTPDPSTSRQTELGRAIDQVFGTLKPAWNGRRRIALDVSHGAQSIVYPNTQSSQNLAEVQRVLDIVHMLTGYRGQALGTAAIEPENIMVITPYAGQRRALVQTLLSQGGLAARIRVRTTAQMQGHETDIAIISFVSNRPGYPMQTGFITQKNQLNVELSRAKHLEILVGNFLAWCQADEDQNQYLNMWRENRAFGSLIKSLRDTRDVISEMDWHTFSVDFQSPRQRNFENLITPAPQPAANPGRGRGRGNAARGANARGGAAARDRQRFDPRNAVRGFGRGGNLGGRGGASAA